MGSQGDDLQEKFVAELLRRLLDRHILKPGGPQELTEELVRQIQDAENELLVEEMEELDSEGLTNDDSFEFFLWLKDQPPLPSGPESFLMSYLQLHDEFALQRFWEETADAPAERSHEFSNRGNSRFALGRIKEALADFDRAVELSPASDHAYACRASALLRTGNMEKALEDIDRAIELSEDRVVEDYWIRRAELFLRMSAGTRAMPDVVRACENILHLSTCPVDPDGHVLITDVMSTTHDWVVCLYQQTAALVDETRQAGLDVEVCCRTLARARDSLLDSGMEV